MTLPSIYELNGITDLDGIADGTQLRNGIIQSPGKFEGQMAYLPAAYMQYLEGFCDDDGRTVRVDFPRSWAGYKETSRRRAVAFIVDDQGFVVEVNR